MPHSLDYKRALTKLPKEELIKIILNNGKVSGQSPQSEAQAVYQQIFDKSTDALFLTRPDSLEIILCNSRAVEMFEVESKDHLLGHVGGKFRRDPNSKRTDNDLQEGNREVEYITHKGHVFWGLKQVSKIRIQDKAYRLVRITDISLRKDQETKKYLSDELYRSVVNTQQEMVCRYKPDTTLTFVNDAYARKMGKTIQDLVGSKFLDLIPAREHKSVFKHLRNVAAGKKPLPLEHMVKNEDGEVFWHQWTDIPIYDEQGNLVEFQGVGLDISSRVRVEKSFRESEEKFRALVMAVPVGIFITDQRGNCNWINRQMEAMFEMSFQKALGNGLYQSILEKDRLQLQNFWKKRGDEPQKALKTICQYKVGDTFKWATVSLNALCTEEEQIAGYVGIIEDITDRKQHEDDIEQARRALEEALKAKDEFLSVVSHEIRTPLNAIIGMTHLMDDLEKYAELEDIINTLRFSSSHLLTMVNDILDFSKIKSGRLELENIPVELKELSEQTINMFQVKARDKKIKLLYELDPELPEAIMGDRSRIGQVLNNLISNAIKFTNVGHVKLSWEKADDHTLRISVEDSGIGMSSEEQRKVFDAFTQANATTSRKYGGTGLGLTITEKLVKLQHGMIKVLSKPGKGTTFLITLPLVTAEKVDNNKDAALSEVDLNRKLSLLYVEDIIPNQLLMKGYCHRWGIHLDVASSGEEAVRVMSQKPRSYDLLLMDIMMPGMDGYQTARKIRNIQGKYYQEVPIIAVTASVSDKITRRYQQFGMNDLVEKPIHPQELLDKIHAFTDRSRPGFGQNGQAAKRDEKNMFSLLKEYHEQNPEEYAELLQSTEGSLLKYRKQLFVAISRQDVEGFRQVSHKLINILMLYQEDGFVALLRKGMEQVKYKKKAAKLERELRQAFDALSKKIIEVSI